jgi:hypothetical protein
MQKNQIHRNLPNHVWEKIIEESKPAEGVEALRPFLRLLAKNIFDEMCKGKKLENIKGGN